jgi:hypothetical protein
VKEYIDAHWRRLLAENGLDSFEALWTTEGEQFEALNYRRGGWSGVSRIELRNPAGGSTAVFVKRQQDHVYRDWCHVFSGRPTFLREIQCILRFRELGIPTLEPVYFGQRRVDGHQQAILVTVALDDYTALADFQCAWRSRAQRHSAIKSCAELVRAIHACGYWHGSLYPNHLLLKLSSDGERVEQVRVIDLEKSRHSRRIGLDRVRDLAMLNRRLVGFSLSDRMRFLLTYLGTSRLDANGKSLWRQVERRQRARKLREERAATAASS